MNKQNEIEKYDYLYENYEEKYGQVEPDEPRFLVPKLLIESIQNVKTVFDAGVGKGGFYKIIKDTYTVYGIEASKVAIEKFHSDDPNIKNILIQEVIKNYPSNLFDVVTCLDVLEHIPESELDYVFENLCFVGKKYFIFSVANHSDIWDGMELHVTQLEYDVWESKFEKYFKLITGIEIHSGKAKIFLLEKNNNSYDELKYHPSIFYKRFLEVYNRDKKSYKNISPFFSVIVPTYNQEKYLGFALDSLINQSFPFWEAVVVNDGSTDSTLAVMDDYSKRDSRIKCFYKENGGTASALNYGIKHAKGEWICWLSSDDMFELDKLEIMKEAIEKNLNIKFFYTHYYYYNDLTKEKTTPDLWQSIPLDELQVTKFFVGNYVHGNSITVHRSVFNDVGYFNETLLQAQDFDMWLRITAKYQTKYINRRTCITRFHPEQSTNIFPEGMYYDSARACIDFINKHKFEEFYPLLDLNREDHIKIALEDGLKVALDPNAFMYKCGYIPAFIDRMNEWIHQKLTKASQQNIKKILAKILKNVSKNTPQELLNAFNRLIENTTFTYKAYDFYEETCKNISKLIEADDQKTASKLDRYLQMLFNKRETKNLPFVLREKTYKPKCYIGETNDYSLLPYKNLLSWELTPITYAGRFNYKLHAKCPKCFSEIKITDYIDIKTKPTEIKFVCTNCLTGLKIIDGEIGKYLMQQAPANKQENNFGNKIAFIARGLNGKSGGTIVYTKYMHWLKKAGCELTIYSDSPKGNWTDIPGEYIVVKNFNDIDFSQYAYVFIYSVLDLGKIISKVNPERIVYVCQAYEGFLYGDSYKSLRTDKPLFQSLHSMPFKAVAVSKHLKNFLETNFGKDTFLVTNSVDLNYFYPDKKIVKDKNTILFIGNPLQPLKGLNFISAAIKSIQNSQYRIKNLKLVIAVGITTKEIRKNIEKLKNLINCKVYFFYDLDSKQMAELFNSSSVYVCCSWYEGFSLSILESMACGTPVITTRNMGAESFCRDGYNSLIVDYGDVTGLTQNILKILNGQFDRNIINNALKTASEHSEYHSHKLFADFISTLKLKNINVSNLIIKDNSDEPNILRLNSNKNQKQIVMNKKLSITYLISKINSISGGNITLLYQTNELIRRGHKVTIVSYSEQPEWFSIKSEVLRIPLSEPMHKYVPRSDVVIATYFQNAFELEKIDAPVKIYFAQGDQFIFDDEWVNSAIAKNSYLQELKDLSFRSYLIKDVKLVLNSDAFAKLVFEKTGRNANGILKVGIDTSIYRPLDKQQKGFRKRILLVGPDNLGTITEPLYFKGLLEAKSALSRLKKEFKNFTLVRISNTKPDIFKNYDCEFYFNPSDELKTYLYGTADILLYPSHYESWGLPPLEAMASKTAVVCTKNIGSEDYCVDKQNCLLIQPKFPDDIYYALKQLLTDDDLLEKIVEGGYFTALKYTKEKEWDNLENMIYDFCEGKIELNNEIEELNDDMLKNEILNLINMIDTKIKNNNFMDAFVLIKELMNNYSENEIKAVGVENTEIQNLAGNIALVIGELEEAQEYFEKELNLNPQSSSACFGLGQIFFAQENYEAAKVMFEWAVKNDSQNQQAINSLQNVNEILGFEINHNSLMELNNA